MYEIDKLIMDIDKLRGNLERLIMQKKETSLIGTFRKRANY